MKVRGILIDPFECSVSEVQVDADDIRDIYRLLSHESMPVDIFQTVSIAPQEAIFVDEEGRIKHCDRWFVWEGYPEILAGKGLILGSNGHGDTASTKIDLQEAKRWVSFGELTREGTLRQTITPWKRSDGNIH